MTPVGCPSQETKTRVTAARSVGSGAVRPAQAKDRVPTRTWCPDTTAAIPAAGTSLAPVADSSDSPLPSASAVSEVAIGWVDICSTEAARAISRSAAMPSAGWTAVTAGVPEVRVPVLSKAAVRTLASCSREPESRTMIPSLAAGLVPGLKASGGALMWGHGVATTSTWANLTGSPDRAQARPAMASETMVKGTATRSARLTKGAREDWALRTRVRIRWYWESA
ncbi:MAG: hypothetical protein L0K94_07010, partial [Acidipropionibacterium jensenii]